MAGEPPGTRAELIEALVMERFAPPLPRQADIIAAIVAADTQDTNLDRAAVIARRQRILNDAMPLTTGGDNRTGVVIDLPARADRKAS